MCCPPSPPGTLRAGSTLELALLTSCWPCCSERMDARLLPSLHWAPASGSPGSHSALCEMQGHGACSPVTTWISICRTSGGASTGGGRGQARPSGLCPLCATVRIARHRQLQTPTQAGATQRPPRKLPAPGTVCAASLLPGELRSPQQSACPPSTRLASPVGPRQTWPSVRLHIATQSCPPLLPTPGTVNPQ